MIQIINKLIKSNSKAMNEIGWILFDSNNGQTLTYEQLEEIVKLIPEIFKFGYRCGYEDGENRFEYNDDKILEEKQ